MAYGPNLLDTFRQGGVIVGKVLSGVKPAELPIELPTRFELVVNLRTAKALGISVPTAVLLMARMRSAGIARSRPLSRQYRKTFVRVELYRF